MPECITSYRPFQAAPLLDCSLVEAVCRFVRFAPREGDDATLVTALVRRELLQDLFEFLRRRFVLTFGKELLNRQPTEEELPRLQLLTAPGTTKRWIV